MTNPKRIGKAVEDGDDSWQKVGMEKDEDKILLISWASTGMRCSSKVFFPNLLDTKVPEAVQSRKIIVTYCRLGQSFIIFFSPFLSRN